MTEALKKLLEQRSSLDSAENQMKMKDFLLQLFNEAEANPLKVPFKITELTEPCTDHAADRKGLAAVQSTQYSCEVEEVNGHKNDRNDDDIPDSEMKTVRGFRGPCTIWVIPDEQVKVLG